MTMRISQSSWIRGPAFLRTAGGAARMCSAGLKKYEVLSPRSDATEPGSL